MSWLSRHIDPTPTHFSYLVLSTFLILYALFSSFIRNRLHLSEPPLAALFGLAFGPRGAGLLDPSSWGFRDNITQELTRVIVGLQVFSVGIELPQLYFGKHWKSVLMLLGPVMTTSWLVTAALVWGILGIDWTTSMIISACLAPTDPVLAASVLAESTFSTRVPSRLKYLLSAESGCNDGVSFPFLYLGIMFMIKSTDGIAFREWILGTLLWQCALGIIIGLALGFAFNRALRYVERLEFIDRAAFLCFYILLAILSIGIGSTLGADDFLVAFGAGYGFASDGWFRRKLKATHLPQVLDLLLNSSMFVYFGAIMPWSEMNEYGLTVGKLVGVLILILLIRRIPIVLLLKPLIPDIRTYREALFCGHFGPMGLGALFLVIEARAQLESGTSLPLPHPPDHVRFAKQIKMIWPTVCFVIFGSTMVHGLSVAVISLAGHFSKDKDDILHSIRNDEQTGLLTGMVRSQAESEDSNTSDDEER